MSRGFALLACVNAACVAQVGAENGAHVSCRDTDSCLPGMLCIQGACINEGSPCLTEARELVADGTRCGDQICVRGVCVDRGCGDGWVDPSREECDPAARSSDCRADCTLPFCGDGIVDPSESCDVVGVDCTQCIASCVTDLNEVGQLWLSNCDLTLNDGCECESPVVAELGDLEITFQGAAHETSAFFTSINSQSLRSRLYRLDTAATSPHAEILDDDVEVLSLSQVGSDAYLIIGDADTSDLFRLVGSEREFVRTSLSVESAAAFTVVDNLIFVVSSGALRSARIGDDLPLEVVSNACDGIGDVVSCAGRVICGSAANGNIVAVNANDGSIEPIAVFPVSNRLPRMTCFDGALLWSDLGTLSAWTPDSGAAVLYDFPHLLVNTASALQRYDDDRLLVLLRFGVNTAYTYLLNVRTGRAVPVARGMPLTRVDHVVVTGDVFLEHTVLMTTIDER